MGIAEVRLQGKTERLDHPDMRADHGEGKHARTCVYLAAPIRPWNSTTSS